MEQQVEQRRVHQNQAHQILEVQQEAVILQTVYLQMEAAHLHSIVHMRQQHFP